MHSLRAALVVALSFVVLSLAMPSAWAGSHALLVAIADYPEKPLPAVLQDMSHARDLARQLGIPPERIKPVFNGDVTRQRFLAELDALAGRVSRDDQVFIYFSGHGARAADPERIEQCREHLVVLGSGRDQLLDERLFKDKVKKIAERSAHVLVMLDTCHSGGLALTRSLGGPAVEGDAEGALVKALPQSDSCKVIRNRSLPGVLRGTRNNITVLAAAQADEWARTTGDKNGGSYATLGWLACLKEGQSADADRSGGVSARELTACAQKRVDALASRDRQKSQHLVLEGEDAQVLRLVAAASPSPPPPPPPAAPLASQPVLVPSAPPSAPPPAPPSVASAPQSSPAAALRELYASRDPNWTVSLASDKTRYRIKQEPIVLRVTSPRAGYLYLLQHTEEDRDACLLFPNSLDQNNQLPAGGAGLTLGNGPWYIVPEGMQRGGGGRDTFTAVVTSRPLNLAGLALLREGDFQCAAAAAAPENLAVLTRIFLEDDAGRGNFGAARQDVEEYQ